MTKTTPSECEVLGFVIGMGVVGFWFGIGAIFNSC